MGTEREREKTLYLVNEEATKMNEQKKRTETKLSYGSRVNAAKINTRNKKWNKKSAAKANNNREFEPESILGKVYIIHINILSVFKCFWWWYKCIRNNKIK